MIACVGQRGEDRVHPYDIYERYETQRCMAGAGGIGYCFSLAPTCSAQSQTMSLYFLAGGSLYYAHDLVKVPRRAAILLKD